MDNNTRHTANFLVSLFISSKYSLKYLTTASEFSILQYIANIIDHEFRLSKKKKAVLDLNQIAIYSRTSVPTVKRCLDRLIKYKILNRKGEKGRKGTFTVGMMLRAYPQRNAKLRTSKLTVIQEVAHCELYLISSSNIKDNNKGKSKKLKKESPQKSNEEYKDALKKLGQKLNRKPNY